MTWLPAGVALLAAAGACVAALLARRWRFEAERLRDESLSLLAEARRLRGR